MGAMARSGAGAARRQIGGRQTGQQVEAKLQNQ